MKKMLIAVVALAVIIAAAAGGAIWYMYTAFRPTVIVQKIGIDFPSDTMLALLIDLEIHNQSPFPLPYAQVDYQVSAATMNLAQGSLSLSGTVDTQKAALLQLPVRVNLANIKELKNNPAEQKTALTIAGNVYLDLKIKNIAFPFSFVREIELKQAGEPANIVIKGVQVTHIAPNELGLAVQIELANNSDKPIKSLLAEYSVFGNKELVLKGAFKLKDMPPKGTSLANVPLTIRAEKLNKLKKENVGKPILFLIKGNITTTLKEQKLQIPFSVTKQQELVDKPFDVKLKKFRIIKLTFKECVYGISLDVKSLLPNEIKNVTIEGPIQVTKDVAVTVLDKNITLLPGKTTELHLETHSQNRGVIKLVWGLIKMKRTQGSMDLKLKGETADGTVISSDAKGNHTVDVDSSAVQKEK